MKSLSPTIIDGQKEEIEQYNRMGQLHIQLVTKNEGAFKNFIPLLGRFKNVKNYIAWVAKKQGDFYVECGDTMFDFTLDTPASREAFIKKLVDMMLNGIKTEEITSNKRGLN